MTVGSKTNPRSSPEAERKYPTHETVIVGVNHHLDLIRSEVLDRSITPMPHSKFWYHELPRELVGHDFL